jgi:hypothetical protein
VPFSAWYSICAPAEHKRNAWKLIEQAAKTWSTHRDYFPWRAWPVVLHHPLGLLIILVLIAGWTFMFGYMGRDRRSSTSEWGGPPPAGAGQHGTAHWRKDTLYIKGFAICSAISSLFYG